MDLINQFIENYKKKLTFYENLGRISSSQLEDALQSAGIRAMVTYRIKNPGHMLVMQRKTKSLVNGSMKWKNSIEFSQVQRKIIMRS